MDLLTHVISGVAIGSVVAGFSKKGIKTQVGILALSGLGAALPDFDAISLWSGFDRTIGSFFHLELKGSEIYSSKLWYSHHGFLHSFFASVLIAFLSGCFVYVVRSRFKGLLFQRLFANINAQKLFYLGLISGFLIHLIEDVPTPASSWSGINFFWPLTTYTGGTGNIWWWNNYDLFLIATGTVVINGMVMLITHFIKIKAKWIVTVIFVTNFCFSVYQVKTRGFDFNYTGQSTRFNEYENKSKEIQRRILGDKIYGVMVRFDNKLKINF